MNGPSAPPHGVLLEDARKGVKLSIREAARRSGISDAWWRAVVRGSQNGAPANGSPETVAAMARTVGVTPEQLAAEGGNPDAAEILRNEEARANVPPSPRSRPGITHAGDGPEAEFLAGFIAKVLRRLSAEDQAVIGFITRMTDGEGRPWPLERKLLEIEKYVDAAEGSERSRPAAGLGSPVHARANARPDRISVRS